MEFCGGTHLASTQAADAFALVSEEGIAKVLSASWQGPLTPEPSAITRLPAALECCVLSCQAL